LTQLLFTSAGNLTALGTQFVNDPAPILGQLITNQGANAAVIGAGLQQTIDFYKTTIPQIPAQLQMIADQLRAGDVSGAVNTVFQIPLGLALPIALFALPPIFQVTTNAAQNFANVVAAIPNAALPLGLSAITPIFAATSVFGDQAQEIVDAVGSGSLATAAGAALSTPTELVNAFLNGTGVVDGSPGDVQSPGILTPGTNGGGFNPGLLAGLLNLRDTIAGALDPVPAPLGLASLSSVPKANTVTLKLADSDTSASPAIPSPKLRRNSTFRSLVAAKPAAGADSSTSSTGADAASNGAEAGSNGADAAGRHRAHPDNPVGSVVKKLRDSARHATGAPRHARAEHSSAD
jgi:hypothetical protein